MTNQGDSEYQFRYKLKLLSDELTPDDLDSLKYLCNEHINTENITSGVMLWRSLQDSGKLGVNNLEFVKSLLTSIGKVHLFDSIFNSTSNGVDSQSSLINSQQTNNTQEATFNTAVDQTIQRDSDYQFRYKLKQLSDKLSAIDIGILKDECCEHILPEKLEKITTSIQLWKELQDSNIIGVNNIEFLNHLFTKINKHRLLEEVFSSPPSGGMQWPRGGLHNDRLDSYENIGSLSTMYPYSMLNTELIDGFNPGQQHFANASAPPMSGPHPQTFITTPPADNFSHYEVNPVPSTESNHGYDLSSYPLLDSYYHPVCTLAPPPPIPPAYDMNQSSHGACIVITNHRFAEHKDRKGSGKDVQKLFHLFTHLGYNVEVKKDLDGHKMKEYLSQVANREEHDSADSFACCILSHGEKDSIFGSDSQLVDIDDLVTPFKGSRCHKLIGKPKMFFIQSCRGTIDDEMVEVFESDGPQKHSLQQQHTLPSEADFFFGFATTRGCSSYRSTKEGSWYIQNLYEVMIEYSRHGYDLLTMHTIVNQRVAEMTATNQPYKQCSAPVSTLRKKVVFF